METFEELVGKLNDTWYGTRERAVEALGKSRDQRAVTPLVKCLTGEDNWIRFKAAEALGELGDKKAVKPLIKSLNDNFLTVRFLAAEALGKLGDKKAVKPLIKSLKNDKHEDVRGYTAWALGELKDKKAVKPLIKSLNDEDDTVRYRVAKALVKIGKPGVKSLLKCLNDETIKVRYEAAYTLGEIGDSRAIEPLTNNILNNEDWHAKERAVSSLGNIKDPRAIESLIKCLSYKGRDVKWRVSDMLIKIGEPAVEPLINTLNGTGYDNIYITVKTLMEIKEDLRAVESLIKCLNYGNEGERQYIAHTLGKIKDPRAVGPLIKRLNDEEDGWVREGVASSLIQIGEPAVEPLIKCLNEKNNREIRARAARILTYFKDPRAIEPLIKCLDDEYWEVRYQAVNFLKESGDPRVIELLIKCLNDEHEDIRNSASGAVGKLGDLRAVEPLIKALDDKNYEVRWKAALSLGKLGDLRAVEPLIECLNDKEWLVRAGAVDSLRGIGDPRAMEPLINVLLNDEVSEVKESAAEALIKIKDPRVIEPLIKALNDENLEVRKKIVFLFGKMEAPRAVEPLIKCLDDKNYEVRWKAEEALISIGNPRAIEPLVSYYFKKYEINQSLLNYDFIKYKKSALNLFNVKDFIWSIKKFSDPRIINIIPNIKGDSYDEKFNTLMIASLLLNNEEYFNILTNQGKQALKDKLMQETGFSKYYHELPFIESIIKFQEEEDDKNVPLLADILKKNKSIENWMYKTKETKKLIKKMRNLGFNTDLYISSGETILEQKAEGRIEMTDSWQESLENIINGITKENKYSIPGLSPKKLYSLINQDYIKFKQGNEESAQNIIDTLLNIIKERLNNSERKDLLELHDYLSGLKNHIETGNKKGTKLIAKVWKRNIPEDLYDNERLACCIFKPKGESNKEIPLFTIDPKTTMLQIWNDASEYSLGAATLYAGVSDSKKTIFLDTFEASHLIYNTLGVDKTKEFVLDSLIEFAKQSKAERLIIYDCNYGKPQEFVDFVKKRYELQNIEFKAIDEDEVLKVHSLEEKHHYTDAFGHWNIMKGNLNGYVIDLHI